MAMWVDAPPREGGGAEIPHTSWLMKRDNLATA